MKKIISLFLVLTLVFACFTSLQITAAADDLPVLRVAVMPFYISSTIGYIVDNHLDEEAGFKIEMVMFPTGGPMNEAIAPDEYDVATIGGAFVFGVANFNAHVIGSFINGTGGNEIWCKKDLALTSEKGYNPSYPDVLGSPETVKGLTIVQNTGTTTQLAISKWLDVIGVSEEDVNIIHMDFAQGYQAFKSGACDVAGLCSPYCNQTTDDMVKVADLYTLEQQLYEELTVTDKSMKKAEIAEILPKFLKLMYQVNDELEANPEKKFEAVKKWYNDNGSTATDEEIQKECDLKPFVTTEQAKTINLGDYEAMYAEFMVSVDKLDPSAVEVVRNNCTDEFLKAALS